MLAKKFRISSKDIENTIKFGKSFSTDNFYGKFYVSGQKSSKVAFVTSIKIEKKSTKRHLLKRRVTYIVEKILKNNPQIFKKFFNLVIFSKKDAYLLNFSQISLEISKILEHISKSLAG